PLLLRLERREGGSLGEHVHAEDVRVKLPEGLHHGPTGRRHQRSDAHSRETGTLAERVRCQGVFGIEGGREDMALIEVPVGDVVEEPEVMVARDIGEAANLIAGATGTERIVRIDQEEHLRGRGDRGVRQFRRQDVRLPIDVDLDGLGPWHGDLVMNREEGRIGGEDLVPGPEERPGRDVFPFDPAVREEHVEAFETEILEDRLDQAGHSGFWRIEIELSLLDAPPDRLEDGGMHRERVRVLRHPGNLPAVFVGELEVVLRRHGWRPRIPGVRGLHRAYRLRSARSPQHSILILPRGSQSQKYVGVYVRVMPSRTTVLLREDVKDHLLRKVGPRGLSDAINEILARSLFRSKKTRFGADPWLTQKGLRDERETHEDL